jgi:peptidoglycan/xylan/chitin deacetylase (PgdA/CDA1 family)
MKKLLAIYMTLVVLQNSAYTAEAATRIRDKTSILVLLYHHFMDEDVPEERYSTTVTSAQFEDHIKTLAENGYNSISLEDLKAYIEDGKALPKNPYMITVDDGYDGNYDIMYPILKNIM